jgi:hypothetical protein
VNITRPTSRIPPKPRLRKRFGETAQAQHQNRRQVAADQDAQNAANDILIFRIFFASQVHQHDDEEKEHHDGSGVYQDLHRRQEMGLEQGIETGHAEEGRDQREGAGQGVAEGDHAKGGATVKIAKT